MGLCKSFFCGRTTRDIELRHAAGGSKMAIIEFDIAVDTGFGDRKKSNYFRLKAFNKVAENMAKYIKKGTKIIVECQPQQESWATKDGKKMSREVHYVLTWEFAESKNAQSSSDNQNAGQKNFESVSNKPKTPANNHPWMEIPDDVGGELPFV